MLEAWAMENWLRKVEGTGVSKCLGDQEEALSPDFKKQSSLERCPQWTGKLRRPEHHVGS